MTLSTIHFIYIFFTILILISIFRKKDITIVCVFGVLSIALYSSKSIPLSIISVFNGFLYAITELLPIILIISIITAFSKLLSVTGINEAIVSPLSKLIKNKYIAY